MAGDVTQAVIHADLGEKIIARAPKGLGGMEVECEIEGGPLVGRCQSVVRLSVIAETLAASLLQGIAEREALCFEVLGV